MNPFNVTIPTFVNPHLFWVTEVDNEESKKALKELMKNIKIKDTHEPLEVGEVVAIRYGENYHRAIIEDLKNEEEGRALFYICWLIDIGTMFETETVYRLPPYARKPKPLALQASLNNVVYVQQHLIFDEESGQPKKIVEYVTMPTILAHRVSLEILQDVKDLKFVIEDKSDGILFGDVLYQKDNEEKSLKQSLIDEGILSINENLFKDIQENIYTYKETHLLLIVQICKKLNSNLILPENNGNKAACRKMISKYLEEFDNSDLLEDHENLQPLNRRRKANHSKSPNSRNSFYSENECASESDASKSREDTTNSNVSNNVSVAKSRTKLMLEKLKRHRKTMEIEELENKGHDALNLSYSISPKQKLAEKDKEDISISVESSSDAGTSLEKTHLQNGVSKAAMETPVPEPKRKLLPKNAIIVPAGASYSIRPMASSTPKPTNSQRINGRTSSDDSDRRSKRPFKSMNVLSEDRLPSEEEKFSISEDKSVEEVAPVEQPPRTGLLNIKPVCSCKQCEHWTQESEWDKKISYGEKVPEIHSVVDVESLMLFKEGIVESERCIKSLDYKNMTKVQKQAMLKVVVHGEYSPVPVKSVTHMGFNEGIHASLRHLDYRETKRIQMYSWPAMFRNQHVCLINGPQTGKTIGYLPIMLSFLLDKEDRYKPLLKLNGPIFIILCASSKKCEDVYDLSKILLGRNKAKLFLLTYPNSQVNTANIEFLVTTPSILVDLLQSNTISFRRLCHLVIEDGDKIFAYETDIAKIFASIQNMLEHRLCHKPVQLVICADHWNSHIENILKMLNNTPLVCIGNYLEAALYGKVQFTMKFVSSASKDDELINVLKETHKISKSVVVCKNEEIKHIQAVLILKGVEATVLSDDMSKEDLLYMEEVWNNAKGGKYTVLVCTDFLLHTLLTITSATQLIHYSLPFSWTKFVKRFSCLFENIKSPLDSKESKIKCQTVVFCDEECEEQMFKFFTFIDQTDLKYRLSDKFKQFSEGIRKDQEQKKLRHQVALCENLKLFGTCSFPSCPLRHIPDGNTGVSNHLPRSGKIKFKIVYIQDVTTYSIELLQHVDTDNKVHEFDHLTDVTQELTDLMSFSKKSIVNPVVGHVYAYYDDSENMYYRCDLLEIDNECVRIKLIDRGTILNIVSVTRLYRLPKEFKDNVKPRKIYDAVLANILPPHKDECFSARSFFHLKTLLEKHDYKNIILTGEVHLQLENTLWLLNVYQEVVLSDRVIPSLQLSRTILQMKLAICDNDHLRRLYSLCDSADIEVPKYERSSVETVNEKVKIEPQWAHLDMEVNEVVLSAAISPDEIYFRLNKYSDLLYTLQKEIQGSLKKPKYPKLNDVEIGTICLAKDPEGEYSRVIVQNIDADKALCFFVDFGDEIAVEISELKHIHKEFITKLPFQAIQGRLHGVKPILSDWQNDVVDILYDYAMEPYTDIFRTLYIKPCLKEENSLLPRQKRYSVVLKDGFGEKKVLVNNLLIECGLARSDPKEEITNFDIPESAAEITDSDDCEEVVNDICRKTEKIEEIFSSTEPDNAKENNDLNEDDLELFLIQPMEFFNQVIFSGENRNGQSNNLELPKIEAAAPVNYCTPDVLWSQTEKTVKLDIKITDVKEYNLTLTKNRIMNFKTVKNDKTYILKIMLYEKVDTMQHTSMGPQIRIVLTKAKDIEWPRLILSKQRTRNIHYDVSTIFVKDENKKILEISDKESDSDDDDNIDMMYEVFSDIDSDVDVEIERDSD